jgi:glutaminyl-peptide cyclotransferase
MKLPIVLCTTILLSACDFSCSGGKAGTSRTIPRFDGDFAYESILQYEKFGPKIPGSTNHQKTGDWITAELRKLGFTVLEQKAESMTTDGKKIPIRNLIARHSIHLKKRVLLSAHWDNRPHADRDPHAKNHHREVPGVNDGGSGVAVLLTIAKAIHDQKPDSEMGVDLAFWDAEDGGTYSQPETFCIGSQYWAQNPIPENYSAEFGINFDMVGRKGSLFPIESYSKRYAPNLIRNWKEAAIRSGHGDYFIDEEIGPVVDDHYFVSKGRGFPMMDLIYMTTDGKFAPEWHTVDDTSEYISRDVMKAVGQTTLELIYGGKDS